jgi:CO/xanthine dehydrogenase Mo-binding subunit
VSEHRGQIFIFANIVDSLMPTINMMPRIEMILVDDYCVTSGIACVPPTARIANAIFNATEVRVTKLPLSPKYVLRALKEVADVLDLHYASIWGRGQA